MNTEIPQKPRRRWLLVPVIFLAFLSREKTLTRKVIDADEHRAALQAPIALRSNPIFPWLSK